MSSRHALSHPPTDSNSLQSVPASGRAF